MIHTNIHLNKLVDTILKLFFVNNIIMDSHNKNLLKQLPFHKKTIKPRIKEFTKTKLLSELPFLEKLIKIKFKQLSTKELLTKQPFYKQPINKPSVKKLSNF